MVYLKPWFVEVNKVIKESKPDIVFLNGFGLTNWILLEAAYKNKIPVCIQHAGIWKKELISSKEGFSPSIRKIFSSFEKEIINKSTHQIFLNEFSRNVFYKIHNSYLNKDNFKKTSILGLPIVNKKVKKIFNPKIYCTLVL